MDGRHAAGIRRRNRSSRRGIRRSGAVAVAFGLWLAAAPNAAAVLVNAPLIPGFDPANELALRTAYTQAVNGNGLFDAVQEIELDYPADWTSRRFVESSLTRQSTTNPAIVATNTLSGTAQFGVLKGGLTVGANTGVLYSDATLDLFFVDIMQIHEDGVLALNWNPSGTVERKDVADQTFARSFGSAEIWILNRNFAFNQGLVDALVYSRRSFTPENGTVGANLVDEEFSARAGSVFWVVGRLTLAGHARARGAGAAGELEARAVADFTHTAQLFVDVAPGSSASFSFASGNDYRTPAPVPLPLPATMLGTALLALLFRVRGGGLRGSFPRLPMGTAVTVSIDEAKRLPC